MEYEPLAVLCAADNYPIADSISFTIGNSGRPGGRP